MRCCCQDWAEAEVRTRSLDGPFNPSGPNNVTYYTSASAPSDEDGLAERYKQETRRWHSSDRGHDSDIHEFTFLDSYTMVVSRGVEWKLTLLIQTRGFELAWAQFEGTGAFYNAVSAGEGANIRYVQTPGSAPGTREVQRRRLQVSHTG